MKIKISFIFIFFAFNLSSLHSQSPYELSYEKDIVITSAGLAISILDLFLITNKQPITAEELESLTAENVNSFDRSAINNYSNTSFVLSDILLAASIASPFLLFTSSKVRDDAGTFSTMSIENALLYIALPHLGKASFDRYRPYVYNPDVPLENKLNIGSKLSFFSGHTTPAFANAVFLSKVYSDYYPDSEWKPYIWTLNLMLAATIGYLRYSSGAHFPTDIITGAVVGCAIGYLIPVLHKANNNSDSKNDPVEPRELIFLRFPL